MKARMAALAVAFVTATLASADGTSTLASWPGWTVRTSENLWLGHKHTFLARGNYPEGGGFMFSPNKRFVAGIECNERFEKPSELRLLAWVVDLRSGRIRRRTLPYNDYTEYAWKGNRGVAVTWEPKRKRRRVAFVGVPSAEPLRRQAG